MNVFVSIGQSLQAVQPDRDVHGRAMWNQGL